MTSFGPRYLTIVLSLFLVAGCKGSEASKNEAASNKAGSQAASATAKDDDKSTVPGTVDPDAVAALARMSAYLTSLKTAQIKSNGSLDVVTQDGQRIQMDGVTNYKLRKPAGFVIDYDSDLKKRRFYYDGKQFTVYAPSTGFYSTVPAPATNKDTLKEIYEKRGIKLPLEDLFRWSDPNGKRDDALKSAYQVGTATIDGVPTDHYAFREANTDWEVWIQQGAQPLPRKLVIVDQTDAAHPTYIARLDWKVNPALAASDFTFAPNADAKRIPMATYIASGESK
ncbi:DUF2092 domain-containing protein [Sphingomonas limnosediminicola]|uniref:DUF2092 domain-containing protein n=1 Tax=Sphingomonas limnosediminicola TaxID=940133 RepID=A0ABP7LIF9_9SPHN